MDQKLSKRSQKVQNALNELDISLEVIELPDSTRTAVEAAQAIGCQIGQIIKSLIFRGGKTDHAILVLASGQNHVNEKKIEMLIAEPLEKANANFVRKHTGFAIGGVPPVGHSEKLATYIDEDLLEYSVLWAAAGTPHAVFKLKSEDLVKITAGIVVDIQ